MMPEQHRMARLSEAYLQAVAAAAGVICEVTRTDYGIDGFFQRCVSIPDPTGKPLVRSSAYSLSFQLKASTHWKVIEHRVSYALESSTYNYLVHRAEQGGTPCILILLCLPKDRNEWVDLDEQRLILRKCCYFDHIIGPPTRNARTQTIRIPTTQRISPTEMMPLLDWAEGWVKS